MPSEAKLYARWALNPNIMIDLFSPGLCISVRDVCAELSLKARYRKQAARVLNRLVGQGRLIPMRLLDRVETYYTVPEDTREDEDEAERQRICIVCRDRPRTEVLLPCSHMSMCEECLDQMVDNVFRCPVCRSEVDSWVSVLFA